MSDLSIEWLRGLAEKGGKGVVNNIDARSLGRVADELEEAAGRIAALSASPAALAGRDEMARVVCHARGYDLATEQKWAAKDHAASINIVNDAFNVADAILARSAAESQP